MPAVSVLRMCERASDPCAAQALFLTRRPPVPADLAAHIPSRVPDWGAGQEPDKLKATWLG